MRTRHRGEGPLAHVDRVLEGETVEGGVGRGDRVAHRLVGIGMRKVISDLRQLGPGRCGRAPFDCFTDPPVQPHLPAHGELVVQRGLYERVREHEAVRTQFGDQPRSRCLLERVEQRVVVQSGHRFDDRAVELVAGDRADRQCLLCRIGQASDPAQDDTPHRVGNLQAGRASVAGPRRVLAARA